MRTDTILFGDYNGYHECGLSAMEYNKRSLWIAEDITSESANEFVRKFYLLCLENSTKPIHVFITTNGGSIESGLAMYDVIKTAPMPVYTYAIEKAYSMGAILLVAGTKRYILPNSKVMIHQAWVNKCPGGNIKDLEAISKSLKICETQLIKILCEHTKKSEKDIRKAISYDHYFTAKEAIEFGLVDDIMNISEMI